MEVFSNEWLSQYPRPQYIGFDNGSEFKSVFIQTCINYGIKPKPSTSHNPQSNGIIERVHLTLGNMLRSFEMQNKTLNEGGPWSSFLAAMAWAIRSTYHTTLCVTVCFCAFIIAQSALNLIFNIMSRPNTSCVAVAYPILKSIAVAYLRPFNDCNKSGIFGTGYGFRFNILLSSRKSVTTLTSPVFFGMMKVGAPHSEISLVLHSRNPPILTSVLISFLVVL
jgi:hypothetical protein